VTKTGLFFGSFNPVHTGHLLIAKYFLQFTQLEKIWFIVSPQNPFKQNDELLDENLRLQMLQLAIEDESDFVASDIEFTLDRPSYTVSTLRYLRNHFPENQFTPIISFVERLQRNIGAS
jgi:nicotinate-nucleotide adenylyltransferase